VGETAARSDDERSPDSLKVAVEGSSAIKRKRECDSFGVLQRGKYDIGRRFSGGEAEKEGILFPRRRGEGWVLTSGEEEKKKKGWLRT